MSGRLPVYSFMLFAVLLAIATGVLIVTLTPARPAEMSYCKVYAQRSSAEVLRRLIGIPFIDDASGKFAWRKAYSYCLNSEEDPPIIVTPTQVPLLDDTVGIVPTDDPTPPPAPQPVAKPVHQVGKSGFATGTDQWVAWCRKNYVSFHKADGTVLIRHGRLRQPCPG